MRKIIKWAVGILLLGGIVGGCFLIYRWWTKPTPEQIKQNEEHKKIFNKQIQEIEKKTKNNKISLEKAKRGEEGFKWDVFDEEEKELTPPPFDSSNKELIELEKKKIQVAKEYHELLKEGKKWIANQRKSKWEKQKNGQWQVLTNELDKNPTVKARFDRFIKSFYQKFAEKKGIKIHEPRIDFRGFGHFYVAEEDLISGKSEMGRTYAPEEEGVMLSGYEGEPKKISRYPLLIDINQVYLLSNGKIGMDVFYVEDPAIKNSVLLIGFDQLIETIAHEIAHALQSIINIDNYKINKKGKVVCSQCESSGERDANENLLYPEWAAEHARLTTEIEQMIKSSSEYQEFKKWWESSV